MFKKGFTLIELLVVISIIGVLSAIILTSVNTARDRARIARVAQDLSQIEKAFILLHDQLGCWPRERLNQSGSTCLALTTSTSNNPPIASLLSGPLGTYLPQTPTFPFPHDGNNYVYDNDLDIHSSTLCTNNDAQSAQGVNIIVVAGSNNLNTVYEQLNTLIDRDANPATNTARRCGKIRIHSSGDLFYNLSLTP